MILGLLDSSRAGPGVVWEAGYRRYALEWHDTA